MGERSSRLPDHVALLPSPPLCPTLHACVHVDAAPALAPAPALDLGLNMDIDGGFGALDSDDDLGEMDGYDPGDGGEGMDMMTMAVPQVGSLELSSGVGSTRLL